MSRQGMIAAIHHGKELPEFDSLEEAHLSLVGYRDACLAALNKDAPVSLDLSLESLKPLEAWFFEAKEPSMLPSGLPVASAIGFYYGQVLCANGSYSWVVEPYAFATGRYEIGVSRPLTTIMLTFGIRPTHSGNKRMQSLWRMAKQYAP
jgi:hypothetical protein